MGEFIEESGVGVSLGVVDVVGRAASPAEVDVDLARVRGVDCDEADARESPTCSLAMTVRLDGSGSGDAERRERDAEQGRLEGLNLLTCYRQRGKGLLLA